ncbi:MAG: hypothetical protein ACRC4N_02555 [Gammaproteobacteria bacterium]
MTVKLKRNSLFEEIGEEMLDNQWCHVDADNDFTYQGIQYRIPDDNKNYKVYEKYDEVHDYKNRTEMTSILVIQLKSGFLRFIDERYDEVFNVSLNMGDVKIT